VAAEQPGQVKPGDSVEVALLLSCIDGSDVDVVPNDAQPWTSPPIAVEYEIEIEGAATASGTQIVGSFTVGAEADLRIDLPLMVAFSLSGLELRVRFYAAGYEVGRARVVVAGAGGNNERGVASTGVLAIPDTVLGS
jgi:hypothetical protein